MYICKCGHTQTSVLVYTCKYRERVLNSKTKLRGQESVG